MLIIGGILIDGTGAEPMTNAVIRTEGDRIVYAGPAGALTSGPSEEERLDATGCAILPGLMNLHTHINRRDLSWKPDTWELGLEYGKRIRPREERREAASILQVIKNAFTELTMGVTTIRDVGTNDFLCVLARDTFQEGIYKGPRMVSAGHIIVQTGGHSASVGYEADGVDGLRKAARYHIKMGCEWIKVAASGGMANWPGHESPFMLELSVEELRAAAEEAHKRLRLICAHTYPAQAIKNCVLAGVDCIEHGCWLDEEAADMMVAASTSYVPTMSNFYSMVARSHAGGKKSAVEFQVREIVEPHRAAVRLAHEKGILIATGTDTNGNLVDELVLLNEVAGMSTMETIKAATANAARVLGLEKEVGTLEPGKVADIIVAEGNPLEDLNRLRDLRHVVRAGERVTTDWFINLDQTRTFSPLKFLKEAYPDFLS